MSTAEQTTPPSRWAWIAAALAVAFAINRYNAASMACWEDINVSEEAKRRG